MRRKDLVEASSRCWAIGWSSNPQSAAHSQEKCSIFFWTGGIYPGWHRIASPVGGSVEPRGHLSFYQHTTRPAAPIEMLDISSKPSKSQIKIHHSFYDQNYSIGKATLGENIAVATTLVHFELFVKIFWYMAKSIPVYLSKRICN